MKIDEKDIIIRYAEDDDFLWLAENDNHISEITLKQKIQNNEMYVVETNGKIIGWLRYNLFWDNVPFMNMICILDAYKNMGLGKKLNKHWEDEMKQKGYDNILTSTQSNEDAQHFYRKLGYKEIGGFKYFNDPYEIIFQKIIS